MTKYRIYKYWSTTSNGVRYCIQERHWFFKDWTDVDNIQMTSLEAAQAHLKFVKDNYG